MRPDFVFIARAGPAAARVGPREQLERLRVPRVRPHAAVEARDRLGVVVQDLGLLGEHGLERVPVAAEVGDQDLDGAARQPPPDRPDRRGEVRRAAVRKVVPVDRRDDGVREAELAPRPRPRARARPGSSEPGLALADRAEAAVARADVAHQHEGRRALARPALVDVRAARLLADRRRARAAASWRGPLRTRRSCWRGPSATPAARGAAGGGGRRGASGGRAHDGDYLPAEDVREMREDRVARLLAARARGRAAAPSSSRRRR